MSGVMVTSKQAISNSETPRRQRRSFGEDFRRFFLSGLAALLPTLITLFLLGWFWNQLSDKLGRRITDGLYLFIQQQPSSPMRDRLDAIWGKMSPWQIEILGVLLAVVLVYIVGLFVGNLIGRTIWRLAEMAVMRIPVVRAIYPAVKQVTDFLLSGHKGQFQYSRVVAVQPHEKGIWSIALVTGTGVPSLSRRLGEEMVTVFVPSSPTAFSGYVLVVPRDSVVELPLTVEEAMRLLVTGGVINPDRGDGPVVIAASSPAPSVSVQKSSSDLSEA